MVPLPYTTSKKEPTLKISSYISKEVVGVVIKIYPQLYKTVIKEVKLIMEVLTMIQI
jgi:hypothetical protein